MTNLASNRRIAPRVLAPIAIIISGLLLQGCFQVLHFLNVNKDGTVDVQWRFVMSAAMRKSEEKREARGGGGPGGGGDNPASGMSKNIFGKKGELKSALEKIATNVVVEDATNDFDVIMSAKFKAKKGARVKPGSKFASGLPIYPDYDAVKKQMVFNFPSDKKAPTKKDGKDAQPQMENPQAKQLAAMMLSTGRYQIIVGGMKIKNAYLVTNKGDEKTRVETMPMGNVTMINFPFLAAMAKYEDGGLRLVIDLE